MIKAGDQITYPDGRPYCKCIKDIESSTLMSNLHHHFGEYEEGSPPVQASTAIASLPFLRASGRGYQICVDGEWR